MDKASNWFRVQNHHFHWTIRKTHIRYRAKVMQQYIALYQLVTWLTPLSHSEVTCSFAGSQNRLASFTSLLAFTYVDRFDCADHPSRSIAYTIYREARAVRYSVDRSRMQSSVRVRVWTTSWHGCYAPINVMPHYP